MRQKYGKTNLKNQSTSNRLVDLVKNPKSSISDYYEAEKSDLTSIPLHRLLKLYNL